MATAADPLEITCESCGAKVVIEPLLRTARCPYCDSPSVVDRPISQDRPDPVFAIRFGIGREQAAAAIRAWIGGKWMAPRGLRRAKAEQVRGIYLPAYLYSAACDSLYSAVIGEVYYATRVDPRTKKARRVREIEFHELKGRHASYLTDVVVTASKGLTNAEIEAIEPFDLHDLMPYSPALISGWISEEPSLTPDESLALAREEGHGRAAILLDHFMPGDSVRNLKRHTMLRRETAELTLLPVWVFAMRYRRSKPPVRFVVNGQTGKVWGTAPLSWAKVALLVAAAAGLIGLIVLIGRLL
jgi:hypothetical protein